MADFWAGVGRGFAPAFERSWASAEREEKEKKAEKARDAAAALAAAKVKEDLRRWEALKAEREDARSLVDTKYQDQQSRLDAEADTDRQVREKTEQQKLEDIRGKLTATGIPQQQEAFKIRGGFPMEGLEPGVDARTLTPTPEQFTGLKRGELVQAQMRATDLQKKQDVIETEQRATAAKLDPKWTAPTSSDAMSPSQRRVRDLLKVMHPAATDKELAVLEWEHYERKGLSATDKGASDIVKVFEKWNKSSALIDGKRAKGEAPTPDELLQFAVYELEIQDHFGRRGRKIPGALVETMKKVWRFPAATVEGPVLGAQDIALSAEEAVRDLDYLAKTLGQDKLDKHVGMWDDPVDEIIKRLFPAGTSMTDEEFQAIQAFKQTYRGLSNKILYLRSGATVTEQEWQRIKKEIGVPDSADFYNRIRVFAKKERRDTKRLLQTRIKARYIFADEIQKEIMEGIAPLKPKEAGAIPDLPKGEPEEVDPTTPTPTPPRKLSAAESVELEGLVNKGVNKLTPAEKIKLNDLLNRQLNK